MEKRRLVWNKYFLVRLRCPIIRAPYVLQINICMQCSTIWNSVAAWMQSYEGKLFEEMYTNKDGWHFSQNVLTLISIYYYKWHMHTTSFFHRFQHRISFFSLYEREYLMNISTILAFGCNCISTSKDGTLATNNKCDELLHILGYSIQLVTHIRCASVVFTLSFRILISFAHSAATQLILLIGPN